MGWKVLDSGKSEKESKYFKFTFIYALHSLLMENIVICNVSCNLFTTILWKKRITIWLMFLKSNIGCWCGFGQITHTKVTHKNLCPYAHSNFSSLYFYVVKQFKIRKTCFLCNVFFSLYLYKVMAVINHRILSCAFSHNSNYHNDRKSSRVH